MTIDNTDDRTVSDRLAALGITHAKGDEYGRRILTSAAGSLGLADAKEACNLLALLEAAQ